MAASAMINNELVGGATPADPTTGRVVPHIPAAASEQLGNLLTGLDYRIEGTWDGQPLEHEPYTIHLEWFFKRAKKKAHKRVVKCFIEGPLIDDPEPPDALPGIMPGLWDYEAVELFFANDRDQYVEIEVGPHGHWLVYLLNGVRQPFNKGEELELQVQNTFEGNIWRCMFEIPLAYFPPNVTKFNAFAVHGSDPNRHYEALYPVTDGEEEEPDFHRLQYFKKIEMKRIVPEGFNDTTYSDVEIGDFWTDLQQGC